MLTHLKNHWFIIVTGIVIIVILFIISQDDTEQLHTNTEAMTSISEQENDENNSESPEVTTVIVDVKGEVQNPGVYEVDQDVRIHDVIEQAGGFLEEADEMTVNLAQKVYDELIVYVPKKGEEAAEAHGQSESGAIKVNYATQEEIEALPGIGPSKAAAIIKHREEHGHFQTIDDLLDISGIGEKTLENMQYDIQIP